MAPVLPAALSTTQHHLPGAGEGAYTLCPFPTAAAAADQSSQQQQQVALFGGEDGVLYVLPSSSTSTTSTEPRAVRTFDEGIRSVAVSSDGCRVAVGLESGETRIFAYESPYGSDDENSSGSSGNQLHAFLNPPSATNANAADDGMGGMDDDDGFGGMMSQEDDLSSPSKSTNSPSSTTGGMTEYAGPRFDAPVRDLAFLLPDDGDGKSKSVYYLAIATESPASFCVVDVATAESAGGERYLQTEAEASHDSGGVRGLAVGKLVLKSSGEWKVESECGGGCC